MDELENLRNEMDRLKRNLDSQQIINRQLLRKVMRQRASWLNTLVIAEIIMIPLIFLIFLGICIFFRISIWYAVVAVILTGVDTALDWRTLRLPPAFLGTASILQVRAKLIKQKKERFWQTCISGALAVVWLALMVYAIATSGNILDSEELNFITAIAAPIGILFGITVMVVIYRKAQRTNDSILHDIDAGIDD